MTQLYVTPKTRCAQGSWTGSSGTRKQFSLILSWDFPFISALPTPLASLQRQGCRGIKAGYEGSEGCTKVEGRKIRASWAERKGRASRSWGPCPASPQHASPCHTQDHISAQPGATSSCPRKQRLLHSSFPQASVVYLLPAYFQQSLFLLPCFKLPQCPSFISLPGHIPAPPFSVHSINSWVSAAWLPTSSSVSLGFYWFRPSSLKLSGVWHLSPSFFIPKTRKNQNGKIRDISSSIPASHAMKLSRKTDTVVYLQIWGLLKGCKSDSKWVLFLQNTGLCILMEYGTALCEIEMNGLLLAYQKSVLRLFLTMHFD